MTDRQREDETNMKADIQPRDKQADSKKDTHTQLGKGKAHTRIRKVHL